MALDFTTRTFVYEPEKSSALESFECSPEPDLVSVYKTYSEAMEDIKPALSAGRIPVIHPDKNGYEIIYIDPSPIVEHLPAEMTEAEFREYVKGKEFKAYSFSSLNPDGTYTELELARQRIVTRRYLAEGYLEPGQEAADGYSAEGLQVPIIVAGGEDGSIFGTFRLLTPSDQNIHSHGIDVPACLLPGHSLISSDKYGPQGKVLIDTAWTDPSSEISQMAKTYEDATDFPENLTLFCIRDVLYELAKFRALNQLNPVDYSVMISASPYYIKWINAARRFGPYTDLVRALPNIYPIFKRLPKKNPFVEQLKSAYVSMRRSPETVKLLSRAKVPYGGTSEFRRGSPEEINLLTLL